MNALRIVMMKFAINLTNKDKILWLGELFETFDALSKYACALLLGYKN